MFSPTHIAWLCIGVVYITVMFILTKKNIIRDKLPLYILMGVSVVSEIIKIFGEFTEAEGGGMVLTAGTLPFQLCSIQIFFIFATFFMKDDSKKEILEAFMSLTMLLGGALAIFIPTYGTTLTNIGTYQYFVFHFSIIYYALYLVFIKKIYLGYKRFITNFILLLAVFVFAIWVNSALQWANTNFMFVVRPPMEGLPILNLNNGWYVYILSLIGVGVVLVSLFHLPFVIIELKNKQQQKHN